MALYCIDDFKQEYEKLVKKGSYKDLEKQLIDNFFDKTTEELASGRRLNHSNEEPYIKKRIKGSGGYRFYYLLIIQNGNVYLMFVHPKTGKFGAENIDDTYKADIYKKVLECIKTKQLFSITQCPETSKILFHSLTEIKESA